MVVHSKSRRFICASICLLCLRGDVSASSVKGVPVLTSGVTFGCIDNIAYLFVRGAYVSRTSTANMTAHWVGEVLAGDTVVIKTKAESSNAGCSADIVYRAPCDNLARWNTNVKSLWYFKILTLFEWRKNTFAKVKGLEHCDWRNAAYGTASSASQIDGIKSLWGTTQESGTKIALLTVPGVVNGGCGPGLLASADAHMWLFLNGNLVLETHNWRSAASKALQLQKGDVLAIKVVGQAQAHALSVYIGTSAFGDQGTTNIGNWVSASVSPAELDVDAFVSVDYPASCSWKAPVPADQTLPMSYRMSQLAPYVQADNWDSGKIALFRTVIGQEYMSFCNDKCTQEAVIDSPSATQVGQPEMFLQVYSAGNMDPQILAGPRLYDGISVCISDYSDGISIFCDGFQKSPPGDIVFYVDDAYYHRETRAPYAIAGDYGNEVQPWNDVPVGKHVIRCDTGAGESVSVGVNFEC